MRSLRREFLSVATVLAIPAVIVAAFPFEAVSFRAVSVPSESGASAAFVTLTAEQEAAALVAAKTAWQSDAADRPRERLPLGELPEASARPVPEDVAPAHVPDPADAVPYRPRGWQPSLRSSAPRPLEPERREPPSLPFPRNELLKLN